MAIKKLIEVALPLDKINEAAAYEKMPGIGAHPRGIHLWWARRPLAAARAVIWASLVDDPSSHPELFPTEEEQHKERERLFAILKKLVIWKNSNNQDVLAAAKKEILKYNRGEFPTLLDPFAGGGAIPLEAQRLGLKAIAHDLNPVAVMINKAMIEIPPRFSGKPPVKPDTRRALDNTTGWVGAQGLAEDVRYYGKWMKEKAYEKIGHLYPKVQLPPEESGEEATVITWIWARTVKCPNPACEAEAPLIHSFALSKKKGKEAYVKVEYDNKKFHTEIIHGKPDNRQEGTISRKGAICACCGSPISYNYLRTECMAGRMYSKMIAVVAEGKKNRIYLKPNSKQQSIAVVPKPEDYPRGELAYYPGHLNTNAYGLNTFDKLFTNRQLTALTTFSSLISDVIAKVEEDALAAGMENDGKGLDAGGKGAKAYGEAVGVYLAFVIDRLADFSTQVSRWSVTNEKAMNLFSKQAIPMTWDFPEVNILGNSVGSFTQITDYISKCIITLPLMGKKGEVNQSDAQSDCGLRNIIVSTDPPYYDNIGYADLSGVSRVLCKSIQ